MGIGPIIVAFITLLHHITTGRIASCFAMGIGPIIVAFITAAITQKLQLSADETFIMKRMECNTLKYQVMA